MLQTAYIRKHGWDIASPAEDVGSEAKQRVVRESLLGAARRREVDTSLWPGVWTVGAGPCPAWQLYPRACEIVRDVRRCGKVSLGSFIDSW